MKEEGKVGASEFIKQDSEQNPNIYTPSVRNHLNKTLPIFLMNSKAADIELEREKKKAFDKEKEKIIEERQNLELKIKLNEGTNNNNQGLFQQVQMLLQWKQQQCGSPAGLNQNQLEKNNGSGGPDKGRDDIYKKKDR